VFRRALSINAEARFVDASDMLQALESAARLQAPAGPVLGSDEVARARTAMERIRRAIEQAIAPPGEIVIPKEIDDEVTTLIAWLSDENTESLNLVDELVRLGPSAIPACLQQGYRLQRHSASYDEVVTALARLGAQHRSLAQLSINKYALSSNAGVRTLCWRACEALQYFPELLEDSLTSDEGVLLPEERLTIADLCIRFSRNSTAVLALVKYMCREYILDPNRYRVLRNTIARRMNELQFAQSALLIWGDSQNRIWEELREFEKLPEKAVKKIELGLIELMAEAFAATGPAGLEVLKAKAFQRHVRSERLPVFRRFATKLGLSRPEARSWLVKEGEQRRDDKELQKVVAKLEESKGDGPDNPDVVFREYLQSEDWHVLNKLRFWSNTQVLERVKVHLSSGPSPREVDSILKLLKGYQGRHRAAVVDVVVTHWERFAGQDFEALIEVLAADFVPEGQRQRVVDLLDGELRGAHEAAARRGLEQLLR
jgi:hypothetical protein